MLLTEEDGQDVVKRWLDSREWWILPYLSENAEHVAIQIERQYFDGGHAVQCEALICPGAPFGSAVMAFRKKRLTPQRLARVLRRLDREVTQRMPPITGEQDVLIIPAGASDEDMAMAAYRAALFEQWVCRWESPRPFHALLPGDFGRSN